MIIAFDGNVYTGKSTVISKLSERLNGNLVNEYSYFIPKKVTKYQDYSKKQEEYLKIDSQRIISLSGQKINLLDRSFVSLTAHVLALYKQNIVDIRLDFLNKLTKLILNNKIIIPTILVHISCDYDTALRRFRKNELTKNAKNTTEDLMNEKYYSYIAEFNDYFGSFFPSIKIETTNNTINENVIKLSEKIKCYKDYKINKRKIIKIVRLALFENE